MHSPSIEEHYSHISTVIDTLRSLELTINPDKSNFFKTSVTNLGIGISSQGIKPSASNLERPSYASQQERNPSNPRQSVFAALSFPDYSKPFHLYVGWAFVPYCSNKVIGKVARLTSAPHMIAILLSHLASLNSMNFFSSF